MRKSLRDDPKRPIRVAHVLWGLMLGGLEQLVLELADRSRSHGIEPTLIAFGMDGPIREAAAQRGISVAWLGPLAGMSPVVLHKMGRALDAFQTDVAHAHDLGPWFNVSLARALRPQTRVVATFHQLRVPTGAKRAFATALAMMSSELIACGDEVRNDLERWLPPGTSVSTIGNGVAIPKALTAEKRAEARQRLRLPPDAIAIGYLGRLFHEKGPDLLVEAFRAHFAARPNVHLVLVGYGPMEAELRERAHNLSNVHFFGPVAEDAAGLMQGFDIYAQASRREGRSLSMLEAMAAGLPTVTHDLPAISEIHTHRTASLVELGDTVAFGRALEALVDHPDARLLMGRAARSAVRRYSVEAMVDQYAALYRRCCPRPAAHAA